MEFYTGEQVCTILNIHRNTLQNMVKTGKIKAFKITNNVRGQWRYDLKAYLKANDIDL